MRILFILLFCLPAFSQQHCGYDFTSYLVLRVHEDGRKENIPGLRITLLDESGSELVNLDNKYSWNGKDEVLLFTENYRIDVQGKDLDKPRWHFPFATESYLLSVTNEFQADGKQVRIEDPKGVFATTLIPIYAFNMYILCTTQAETQQFGPRRNKPIDIILSRK